MTAKPAKFREHSTVPGQLLIGIFLFCVFPPFTATRKTNRSCQGNYDANLLFSKAEIQLFDLETN